MRVRFVPGVAVALGAVSGGATLLLALVPGLPMGPRFAGLLCFGAGFALMGLVVARRAATLSIDRTLTYRRLGTRLELPRDAVRAVRVVRPLIPLRRPTTYTLVVRAGERTFQLPFAEHWLLGARAFAKASGVARALGVPMEDRVGERWRASRVPLVRWMGRGEEWRVLAVVAPLAVGAGLVAGWLTLALR